MWCFYTNKFVVKKLSNFKRFKTYSNIYMFSSCRQSHYNAISNALSFSSWHLLVSLCANALEGPTRVRLSQTQRQSLYLGKTEILNFNRFQRDLLASCQQRTKLLSIVYSIFALAGNFLLHLRAY